MLKLIFLQTVEVPCRELFAQSDNKIKLCIMCVLCNNAEIKLGEAGYRIAYAYGKQHEISHGDNYSTFFTLCHFTGYQ